MAVGNAVQHNVAGPATIKFGVSASEATLGYTRDGAQITIQPFFGDIQSDDYGGQGGAPADTQLLGMIGRCRCEMPKYNETELHKLTSFQVSGTALTLPALGTLIRQDSKLGSLVIQGSNQTLTFAQTVIRDAFEVNKGTKFATAVVGFEMWIDAPSTRVLGSIA